MWCGVVWWCAATLLVQWSTASIMHGRDCMHPQRRGTAMAETCARLARSLGVVNIVQQTAQEAEVDADVIDSSLRHNVVLGSSEAKRGAWRDE